MATLTEPRRGSASRPVAIAALPGDPQRDGHYVFRGLGRSVVEHNHGLHKYPAKFVPQIPRWALDYDGGEAGETVLDPFGGSGTTALEAALTGRRAISVDINPLARVIASAKTATVPEKFDGARALATVLRSARRRAPALEARLVPGVTSCGMHHTWSNWFDAPRLAALLAIREAIDDGGFPAGVVDIFLASVSSIAKSCSLLDENQIKVRLVKDKARADPFEAFELAAVRALVNQRAVSPILAYAPPPDILIGSATSLPLGDRSVDRVITSPPYINAVDYTMAHKYNMFVLGALAPSAFKDHCRDYVGMTERAVRASDLRSMPICECEPAQLEVEALWRKDTPLGRNRSFVVAQFFNGMEKAFKEIARTLKPGGKAITVLGDNRVCGNRIPTASICRHLAASAGLEPSLRFFHHVTNVSSMRLSRNSSGGSVPYETIDVYTRT